MQPLLNDLCRMIDRLPQRAFPDDGYAPAKSSKRCCVAGVPVDIPLELSFPKICICPWRGCKSAALVPMPKAAMHEYHGPVLREHEIRGAWEASNMQPVAEPTGKKTGAKHPLRPSIFSADARHHAAALGSGWKAHGLEKSECLWKSDLQHIQQNTLTEEVLEAANGGALWA